MKRKVKKSLILLVSICCSISANVNAATIGSLKLNAGKIEVSGNSSAGKISYKIYSSSKSGTQIGDICDMGEAEVSDGKFLITLRMPKIMQGLETDGSYNIDIKDDTKITQNFLFTGYSYRTAFLADINTKTTVAEICSLFEGKSGDNLHNNTDIMKNLGVNADYYSSLSASGKNEIANAFLAEKGTTSLNEGNFSTIYNHAESVHYINRNPVTDTWLNESSFTFDGVKFQDADSELKSWIADILGDGTAYNFYSDIDKKYREANVLYLLDKSA